MSVSAPKACTDPSLLKSIQCRLPRANNLAVSDSKVTLTLNRNTYSSDRSDRDALKALFDCHDGVYGIRHCILDLQLLDAVVAQLPQPCKDTGIRFRRCQKVSVEPSTIR